MSVSRLFVEIGKDVDRLNSSLRDAMNAAKEAGQSITASGQRIVASFDQALNPTKALGEQIKLLEIAGKSQTDIWAVYGDRMKSASDAAQKNNQVIDPLIKNHLDLGKATEGSRLNFENLGKSIQSFAQNPLEAAKAGLTSMLTSIGPVALGFLGVGAAVAVAGKEFLDFAVEAADNAEHLKNLSSQTGIAVQQLDALQEIAKEAGLEGLDLGRTLGMLNTQMGKGSGDFIDSLHYMGIEMTDIATGKPRDVITLLDEMRLKLLAIPEGAERTQAAQAALGGRLRELIPLLLNSNTNLQDMIDKLVKMGATLDPDTERKLLDFDQRVDSVSANLKVVHTRLEEAAANILSFGESTLKAHPYLDAFGYSLANLIGGADGGGLAIYDGLLHKATEKTNELANANKSLATAITTVNGLTTIPFGKETSDLLDKWSTEDTEKNGKALIASIKHQKKEMQEALEKATADAQTMDLAVDLPKLTFFDPNIDETLGRLKETSDYLDNEFFKSLEGRSNEFGDQLNDDIAKMQMDLGKAALDATGMQRDELLSTMDQISKMQEDSRDWIKTTQEQQLDALHGYYEEIETLREMDLISEEQAAAAKKLIDAEETSIKLSQAKNFFGSMAKLQGSHIREIAAIGKAAAIAQATINTYQAATKAYGDGGIWGAVAAAAVLAEGFALVSQISAQGFAAGGLVAGGEQLIRVNEQGPEFMMNAAATRDYYPLLQMLNEGHAEGSQTDRGSSFGGWTKPTMNISIANYGSSKQFDVEQIDENTVRVIARDEAMGVLSRRGPEVIANDLTYANSKTSKAVARHTTARRADR